MTRSVPFRHLTVHPPAAGTSPAIARGQAAKGPARQGFAELLRAPLRPASGWPSIGTPRADAVPVDAGPAPEVTQSMVEVIDAAEEGRAAQGGTAGDVTSEMTQAMTSDMASDMASVATEGDPGLDADSFDEAQAIAARPLPELPGACEVGAVQVDAPGASVVRYLAATVADFCNHPAVHAGDGWTVRLVLNENILPSTTLHLSLSLHWLLLRFDCGDAQSKGVISAHCSTLQSALEDAVSPRRDVSIDID